MEVVLICFVTMECITLITWINNPIFNDSLMKIYNVQHFSFVINHLEFMKSIKQNINELLAKCSFVKFV